MYEDLCDPANSRCKIICALYIGFKHLMVLYSCLQSMNFEVAENSCEQDC